jgi:hypothetical protein
VRSQGRPSLGSLCRGNDLGKRFVKELGKFFVDYRLPSENITFSTLRGREARRRVKSRMRAAKRKLRSSKRVQRNYEDESCAEVFALRIFGLPSNSCISVIAYTPSFSQAPHRLGKDRVCDSLSTGSEDFTRSYGLAAFPVTGMVAPQ